MQAKSFPAKIDGSEIEFQLKQLKFRDQEQVVSLVGVVSEKGNAGALSAIRQAMQICLVGWSLDRPVDEWDQELDIVQAIQVVNACLTGNVPSETERKK